MENKYEPAGRSFTEVIRLILEQSPSSVRDVNTNETDQKTENEKTIPDTQSK